MRVVALLIALVTVLFIGAGASTADAKPRTADPTRVDITGTLADGTGDVTGTWDVSRFAVQDGGLVAIGTFEGTITDEAGEVLAEGTQAVTMPVNLQQSERIFEILDRAPSVPERDTPRIVFSIVAPASLMRSPFCSCWG